MARTAGHPTGTTTAAERPRTRFAPAPTGYLHLGHVANAIWVWGLAQASGGSVLLRVEDHDRQRCRSAFDAALIDDLDWLGFVPDAGPVRQTDADAIAAYADALERLRAAGLTYGCTCTRSTFAAWASGHGRSWIGPGCPGDCRAAGAPEASIRVALGGGTEAWEDAQLGRQVGEVGADGDLVVRDRHGQWTYGFAVVVDDLRQGIDLVVRGRDLLGATPGQIRLARLLGGRAPATFAHHPLIRRADGHKLSKSSGDTGVRELRARGHTPDQVVAMAAGSVDVPFDVDITRRR